MAAVLFLAVVGLFVFTVLMVACWQTSCWFFRTILGIPKYPPFYEPPREPLPWYLDDRIKPAAATKIRYPDDRTEPHFGR